MSQFESAIEPGTDVGGESSRTGDRVPPQLGTAIEQLLSYCKSRGWAGFDPYDGLNSRFIKLTMPFSNRFLRLAWIQAFKRFPINLRRLLLVAPAQNPKGMALFASAMIMFRRCGMAEAGEARGPVERLLELRSPGWRHACWGYNFDWQTRT